MSLPDLRQIFVMATHQDPDIEEVFNELFKIVVSDDSTTLAVLAKLIECFNCEPLRSVGEFSRLADDEGNSMLHVVLRNLDTGVLRIRPWGAEELFLYPNADRSPPQKFAGSDKNIVSMFKYFLLRHL